MKDFDCCNSAEKHEQVALETSTERPLRSHLSILTVLCKFLIEEPFLPCA